MINNIFYFAKVNPWTTGLTIISLALFILNLFLVNRKDEDNENAKLSPLGLNLFMVFMIAIIIACIVIIGYNPYLTDLIDKSDNVMFLYWIGIGVLWLTVKYVTGTDLEELWDDMNE